MDSQGGGQVPDEEMVASRTATFGAFVKLSTVSIVGVALVLILMALFLL